MQREPAGKTGRQEPAGETGQLSLLHGFVSPSRSLGTQSAAPALPIARVLLDSPLPHLDRPFDYLVPENLDDDAVPGARVRVRFGGQELSGFIIERTAEADTSARLMPLGKVVSPQPVLAPQILRLAEAVAARYSGTVHDVLRVAIPPRAARVDKEFTPQARAAAAAEAPTGADPASAAKLSGENLPSGPEGSGPNPWSRYPHGPRFLTHLAAGHSPRAALSSLGGYGAGAWPEEIAAAVQATLLSGRGAVVVVPDAKDLARVETALIARIGKGTFARLTADDGPTPRYRSFLQVLHGDVQVVIGTRSAAYAPVRNLGLAVLWDDADDLHAEQRAPYQHVRDVLLLRAAAEDAALLLASHSRSTEAQRLVASGWAANISADRSTVRSLAPRVVSTADSFNMERDPLAARARIPHAAWKAAQDGLTRGPVLVQVARTGFSPALSCQECREPARCRACAGPLGLASRNGIPACRWCGRPEPVWSCSNCGGTHLRGSAAGAGRTAEELGRAFPSVTVISSAGDHVRADVPDAPALVVATPGAEPVAAGGYAAAILLDGNAMMSRESLRAGEDTLRRWFSAAALVRPAGDKGVVVVTADDTSTVGHLLRWDPAGAADRELALRGELGLPPAVRYAELTGSREALTAFLPRLDLPAEIRVVGPAPLEDPPGPAPVHRDGQLGGSGGRYRTLLFFSYAAAPAVTAALRATKAAVSARRTGDPVYVRVDGTDVL
ncbi:primosomal protein N' [Arthrobacter sp. zg-Y820]|uniref:primosomal protein N' n=1 Tax=unclassified Arthrobacter TaxID=235627 RepID=UPI001E5C245F|nr:MULTISPECIES: primosomal protein N' [unclassified Arthrobacter]MCC9196452.1 primosomal protein N' [Arthrobacter sp. zg-Y820]MDK1279314.1 primosomal protein N' [Arthrobacter sp. zg.Y820]WIB08295.1 primosomal protein N' [Arthrobacter sp. zg-Y820]